MNHFLIGAYTWSGAQGAGDVVTSPGCQPAQVEELVGRFLDAVNRGDPEGITQGFSIVAGPAGVSP